MKLIGIVLLVILLIIFLTSIFSFNQEFAVYETKMTESTKHSRMLVTDKYEIQYEVRGAGTPILVSHGITGGIDQGKGLADTYLKSDYQYIFVSRFGYLQSSIPDDPSVQKQAEAYKQLLDHLKIEKVWIFGNSAGGTSAIQFAMSYPENTSGIILHSSNLPGEYPSLPPKPVMGIVFGNNYLYWSSMKLFGNQMLKNFMTEDVYENLDSTELKTLQNSILLSSLPITKRKQGVIFDMFTSNPYINQQEINFSVLKMPIIIINSVDDPSIPIEYARDFDEKLLNSELVEVKGGHLMIGSEDVVQYMIDLFIKRKEKN